MAWAETMNKNLWRKIRKLATRAPNRAGLLEIGNRLQFLVVISIFFVGLIYNFSNIYNRSEADKMVLGTSWTVITYLLAYIFFDLFKNKISQLFYALINILTFTIFFLFVLVMAFLNAVGAGNPGLSSLTVFLISIWGLKIISPALVIVVIMAGLFPKK